MKRFALSLIGTALALSTQPSFAGLKTETILYSQGGQTFEGFVTYPKDVKAKQPGVLLLSNWMGVSDETRYQAERIAGLGYIVFAADVYGKGVRPKSPQEAGATAGQYKADRKLFRERVTLGLEQLKAQKHVDSQRLLAAGYCFGGTGVLELARTGAHLRGVVSFHGGLDSPTPADGKHIKAKVLVLHGADDPMVKAEDKAAFEDELRKAGVDWQLISYGNTVHSFTDRAAGNDASKGAAYNLSSDARSFAAFQAFAKEVL